MKQRNFSLTKVQRIEKTLQRREKRLEELQEKLNSITENLVNYKEIRKKIRQSIQTTKYQIASSEVDLQIERHRNRL